MSDACSRYEIFDGSASTDLLVAGTNTIAVEVHKACTEAVAERSEANGFRPAPVIPGASSSTA